MSETNDTMSVHRDLLQQGMPAWIVRKQVEKYKADVQALPDDTPDKQNALQQADAFLKELEGL